MITSIKHVLKSREDKLLNIMQTQSLDYVIIYNNANIKYFCEYEPFFGDAVYILSKEGNKKLIIRFDWEISRILEFLKKEDIIVSYNYAEELIEIITDKNARIGIAGHEKIPYKIYNLINEKFGNHLVSLDEDIVRMRLIKDKYEIEMIKHAVKITEDALLKTYDIVKEGVTEEEISAYFEYNVKKSGAGLAFQSVVASGENCRNIVSIPSNKKIKKGEFVVFDLGARYKGYCADISRTIIIGNPTIKQSDTYKRLLEIQMETIKFIKPGMIASDIHKFTQKLYDKNSFGKLKARLGHGIGIETSMEGPDLKNDHYKLEENMCFCTEISIYYPDIGGMKIEDDLVLKENGCEILSNFTRELIVK